jgi:hypothetical protein
MSRLFRIVAAFGLAILLAMHGFGFGLEETRGEWLPQTVNAIAMGMILAGLLADVYRMVVAEARTVGEEDRRDVPPDRVFDYRRQKLHAAFPFGFAVVLAAPLVVGWPGMLIAGIPEARHPAIVALFVFLMLMAAVLVVVGRRGWSARVELYADRLAVRGIYSNGSLKWDDARSFEHVEVWAGRWNTMWVYVLRGENHGVRVEYSVRHPEEFIREVETRTGLRLAKCPLGS